MRAESPFLARLELPSQRAPSTAWERTTQWKVRTDEEALSGNSPGGMNLGCHLSDRWHGARPRASPVRPPLRGGRAPDSGSCCYRPGSGSVARRLGRRLAATRESPPRRGPSGLAVTTRHRGVPAEYCRPAATRSSSSVARPGALVPITRPRARSITCNAGSGGVRAYASDPALATISSAGRRARGSVRRRPASRRPAHGLPVRWSAAGLPQRRRWRPVRRASEHSSHACR